MAVLLVMGVAASGCGAGYGEPVSSGDTAQSAGQTEPGGTPGATTTSGGGGTTTTGTTPAGGTTTSGRTTTTGGGDQQGGQQNGGQQGSGGDGGAAALTAYAQAANSYCSGLTAAGAAFNRAAQDLAGSTGAAALRGAGRGIVAFSDALKRATGGLRSATPPSQFRRFNSSTLAAVSKVTSAVDGSRSALLAGNAGAMQRVGAKVQGLQSSGNVKVPSSLASRAPACKAFAG
ncbi:hypothetical protein [Patulibacter defluvii]|uniref:hypothetical protein n=1 Tax=Patulibacter defluvii TaxID=3095358 RepID=UPI002A750329|nr:hypothetical protein [Patulibacter sp. DM4]